MASKNENNNQTLDQSTPGKHNKEASTVQSCIPEAKIKFEIDDVAAAVSFLFIGTKKSLAIHNPQKQCRDEERERNL